MAEVNPPPSVTWAQRDETVYVTFEVECKDPEIHVESKSISFKGVCLPENKVHEVKIDLYAEIVPEKSKWTNNVRHIEMVLAKEKTEQPYWPSLTSGKVKYHWLKIDFVKWLDEDEMGSDVDVAQKFCNAHNKGPESDWDQLVVEEDLPHTE